MQPLLFDEGLPPGVAHALSAVGWRAHAVGESGAPPKQSSDESNCKWCVANHAVLVTNDWGKKNREILRALDEHGVDAIFVPMELRKPPAHSLLKALLISEGKMDQVVAGPKRLRHRLRVGGGLKDRY